MEESFPLCQEYYGMDHGVHGKYEFSSEQQFPYCNAAKSSNVVSPLHPGSHQYHRYSGTTNVIANNQELDLDSEDNALTYIDNILDWDFTAFDVSDSSQDSLPVFGYPYDVNFLADASLPSFSLDALVDERGESFNTESSQGEQRVPKLEPCCLTDVYNFEVNTKQYNSKEEIITSSMLPKNELGWNLAADDVSSSSIPLSGGEHECNRCEVLRQIVHTSGHQGTKLEIHVCDGDSYHAVMQTKFLLNDGFPPTVERQMVEFPAGNFEYVKQFLLQYSVLQKKEGFMLQQDCLLHDVIATCCKRPVDYVMIAAATCCFKASEHDHCPAILSDSKYETSANEESYSLDGAVKDESLVSSVKPIKSSAAAQREKTGKLKMSDLAKHFHLPINIAAKELGICPTVLKKICRRNGMRRWPHRKIKSIERIIATLEQTIAEGPGLGDEGIRNEIAMLRNERSQLCAGLVGQSSHLYDLHM